MALNPELYRPPVGEPIHPMFKKLAEELWETLSTEYDVTLRDESRKEEVVGLIALMLFMADKLADKLAGLETEASAISRQWGQKS